MQNLIINTQVTIIQDNSFRFRKTQHFCQITLRTKLDRYSDLKFYTVQNYRELF